MGIRAIIYQSATGYTYRYASALAAATDLPCYTLLEAKKLLPKGTEVVYLGWVRASVIQGLKKALRFFPVHDEFKLIYDIIKIDGKRYLDYESCEGVVRLGYIGSTDIYNSESNYLPAEEIVRRLALYRLINLAKEYGADALFEPTITTTATSTGKKLTYKTEASAKLIKIIND